MTHFTKWQKCFYLFCLCRWGVIDVNPKAEPARPEYLAKLEAMTHVKTTYNVVTREEEQRPYFWWTRFQIKIIFDE